MLQGYGNMKGKMYYHRQCSNLDTIELIAGVGDQEQQRRDEIVNSGVDTEQLTTFGVARVTAPESSLLLSDLS